MTHEEIWKSEGHTFHTTSWIQYPPAYSQIGILWCHNKNNQSLGKKTEKQLEIPINDDRFTIIKMHHSECSGVATAAGLGSGAA